MALKIGDKVIIPKGSSIGMGKLSKDEVGIVSGVQHSDQGSYDFYSIRWVGKRGRERINYYKEDEVIKVSS